MRRLFPGVLCLLACGSKQPTPDAGPGIDTSCGIDCAAQKSYGLIAGTCFEYSDTASSTSPPSLAAEVMPVTALQADGGMPVMQVKYTQGGQRLMQDSFTIVGSELKLVRREFGAGGTSVTYKTSAGDFLGAKWLALSSAAGENYSTSTSADVIAPPAARVSQDTTYRVTTSAPGASEYTVPYATFDAGVKLLFNESPTDHGSDSRRIWVPGVGFSLIATPLMLAAGTTSEYQLQNIKTDGGLCGF